MTSAHWQLHSANANTRTYIAPADSLETYTLTIKKVTIPRAGWQFANSTVTSCPISSI